MPHLRALLVTTLALWATIIFGTQQATAQTIPYNWYTGGSSAGGGCTGAPAYAYCISPDAACTGQYEYYLNHTFLSLGPGTDGLGKPAWVCKYIANSANITGYIHAFCPSGYVQDIYATNGCVKGPVPKTLGDSCTIAGNPVTICSGNKYQKAIDFRSAGTNILEFTRYYNSQGQYAGTLGISWQHNWERRLIVISSSSIRVIRPDGQELSYSKVAGNWITWDKDVTLKLAASGSDYTLTTIDGTVETYDSAGKLQSVAFANGYTQTLTYTSGQLTEVADNQDRTLTFTYDGNGNLDTMTDPDGNDYSYAYTDAYPSTQTTVKLLTGVTFPAASAPYPEIEYHYEDTNFPTYLTGITDELGELYATWTYDSSTGQTTSSEHAGGAGATSITYNGDGTKTVTYPLGEQIKYTFATVQGAPKVTRMDRLAATGIPAANRVFTYDLNGFLASETDWNGNKTTYVNNTRGLETSRTEAATTGLARTITTTWHSTLAVPTQITAPRKTTTFTYDSAGNMLTRTETDTTSQSVPYSTNGQTRTWTYTYDSLGHVLTVTGPRTDVTATTTYTYDATTGNLETVTDALNHVSTIDSYNNRGLPTQMTDPNGMVTTFTYDERGRLLTRTVDDGGADATTTFAYNAAGLITSITLPDGYELNYEYDDAHRLTAVENDGGERIEYTLDDGGNITEQDVKNSGGGIVKTQSRTFDIIGRMLEQIGASSQTTTYGYDSQSNRTSVEDALSETTAYAFDALNRLITITDPLTHATSYAYDAQDNRTSVTDPRSLVTSYVYDGFGRVIQETSPDRGTTVYVLDKAGNVTSETDARSIVTNRTFDKLDRVLTETFPSSSGEDIDYTYDSTSGGNYGIGHLTGFTDGSGSTTLAYDKRGNVISTTRTIGSESYTTAYAYDLADHITSITYPSGTVIGYGRDDSGRISSVTLNPSGSATTLASNVTYKAFGPLADLDYGNGLGRTHGYDQDFRLTAIVTNATGADIQDLEITYNAVDNITSITDYLDSTRDQDFTYDDLYRLIQAAGKYGTIDYTYDNNGNRATRVKSSTTQTYSYSTGTNRLTSITNYSGSTTRNLTYANNGNVATDDRAGASSYAYTFGHRNRYDALSIGGSGAATYTYNARGERVSKTVSSTTTHFHYDEAGHLIAESDGTTGNVIREYVWLDDMPLAQIESGGSIYYIHPDHLNTPQKITEASKNVVWDRIAEPFGEQYSLSSSITHNLRFPGQFADSESALNYNYFRDYDPTSGRYIEADPIGLDGTTQASMGLYNYTPANPLRYTDPRGHDIFGIFDFGDRPAGMDEPANDDGPKNCPSKDKNKYDECYEQCKDLLPSPSGDLQSSEFSRCYRQCLGRL